MSHYHHLSIEERESIWEGLLQGKSRAAIARELQRSPSTITREIRRNSYLLHKTPKYRPSTAERRYQQRRERCRRTALLQDPALRALVERLIVESGWSPEQISGRLELEQSPYRISHTTIYRWLHAGEARGRKTTPYFRNIVLHLRHRGKNRRRKGNGDQRGRRVIHYRLSERAEEANLREAIGHWEADTVQGKINSGCVLTMVDRKSRYLIGGKVARKFSLDVAQAMCAAFERIPSHYIQTVTQDRGTEFTAYSEVLKIHPTLRFYFCDPHCPWQRPTSKNTNGLLRQYIPPRYALSQLCDEQVQAYIHLLNNRPRKCLGWCTPAEVFFLSHDSLHLL